MNLVKDLVTRIEKRLTETKKPCKLYATEAAAEKVAESEARILALYFAPPLRNSEDAKKAVPPARYIIVFIPSVGKWAIGFDQTEVMSRPRSTGGYVGIMADRGFYTF